MKKEPDLINKINVDNKLVVFKIYLSSYFEHLQNVTQVYAIVLNEVNDILLVSSIDRKWQLPGGTVEPNETFIDTLIRELDEETSIEPDLDTVKPFFYQDVFTIQNNQEVFGGSQVRFICRPKNITPFTHDPDNGHIMYHQWTKLDILHEYLNWGPTAGFIQKHLQTYL